MMTDSIPARLFLRAAQQPDSPAYYARTNNHWQETSWSEYADEVKRVGKGLLALGLQPGECIALLGFNRPEWIIANVAAMAIGASAAGVYATYSSAEVATIVGHCEARIAVVENEKQWQKIREYRERLPELRHVIMMAGAAPANDPLLLCWEELLTRAEEVSDDRFDELLQALEPGSLASLAYTAGTSGSPRGVMLSHENLAWTADTMADALGATSEDTVLSYLPLSHVTEQMMSIYVPISAGYPVYFAESLQRVFANLKDVQPSLVFGVPRVWERFYAGLTERLAAARGIRKRLLGFVRRMAAGIARARNAGHEPGTLLRLGYAIARRFVLRKLKARLGLGGARVCLSGTAQISKQILEFFASLDVVICELYGQSESSGATSLSKPGAIKYGTVGHILPDVEAKIARDGELLIRGPNVFLGYRGDEQATDETLAQGWLHTGDLATLDSDGFLAVTGRKQELITTNSGKNVAPANIEAALKNAHLINDAVVIGDDRTYLTALVTLDEETTENFLGFAYLDPMHEQPEVLSHIQDCVDSVNATLGDVEPLKKWTILPRNFTMEAGELTPTLKVRRQVINEHFAREIEAMYAETESSNLR